MLPVETGYDDNIDDDDGDDDDDDDGDDGDDQWWWFVHFDVEEIWVRLLRYYRSGIFAELVWPALFIAEIHIPYRLICLLYTQKHLQKGWINIIIIINWWMEG